jgi:FkbM family methyltransferase
LLKEGMTVMDVGANVGMYSLLAARVVGPTGKVYAFEPVPDTFARLQEHITMNGLTHVVPISIALSDSNGTVKISVARNGRSSLFLHTTSDFIEVPMETLDSFIASHGIEEVHAIKVDVEGSEMHVVRGMRQLLSRSDKPLLMFEINPSTLAAAGTTAEELFNAIVSYGYAGHVIRKGQIIPVESIVNPTRQGKGFYFDDYLFKPSS